MKNKTFFGKDKIVRSIFILLGLLLISFAINTCLVYKKLSWQSHAITLDVINNRVISLAQDIEGFSLRARENLRELSTVLAMYSLTENDNWDMSKRKVQSFVDTHVEYAFVNFSTEEGDSFNTAGQALSYASSSFLTLIENDPEFKMLDADMRKANDGSIQISGLKTYIDEKGDSYPFLYVVVPLIVDQERYGKLSLIIDLNHVFNEIKREQRPGELIFLADADGVYLVPLQGDTTKKTNLFTDYPVEVTSQLFSTNIINDFVYEGKLFTYRHISVPGIRQGVKENHFWVLGSISEEKEVFKGIFRLKEEFIFAFLTSALMLVIVGVLVLRMKDKK